MGTALRDWRQSPALSPEDSFDPAERILSRTLVDLAAVDRRLPVRERFFERDHAVPACAVIKAPQHFDDPVGSYEDALLGDAMAHQGRAQRESTGGCERLDLLQAIVGAGITTGCVESSGATMAHAALCPRSPIASSTSPPASSRAIPVPTQLSAAAEISP